MLRHLHPVGFLRVLSTDFLVVAAGYESRRGRAEGTGSYALPQGRGSTEYCVVLGVRRKTGDSGQDSREDTKEEWDDRTGDAVTRTQSHTGRKADNGREDEGLGENIRL